MTNAIFLNTKVKSSQPVHVELRDGGAEIRHAAGDHIVFWPYEAIGRDVDEPPNTYRFYLGNSYKTLVQILDSNVAAEIIARSPRAQGSRYARILRVIGGVISEADAEPIKERMLSTLVVIVVVAGALLWGAWPHLTNYLLSLVRAQ